MHPLGQLWWHHLLCFRPNMKNISSMLRANLFPTWSCHQPPNQHRHVGIAPFQQRQEAFSISRKVRAFGSPPGSIALGIIKNEFEYLKKEQYISHKNNMNSIIYGSWMLINKCPPNTQNNCTCIYIRHRCGGAQLHEGISTYKYWRCNVRPQRSFHWKSLHTYGFKKYQYSLKSLPYHSLNQYETHHASDVLAISEKKKNMSFAVWPVCKERFHTYDVNVIWQVGTSPLSRS